MPGFSLSTDELRDVFPFHLAWDEDGRIVGQGRAMERILGSLIGRSVDDCFHGEFGFDGVPIARSTKPGMRIIRSTDSPLRLRGEIVGTNPRGFIGSPTAVEFADLIAQGVEFRDLAHHDSLREHLFRERTQRAALEDTRQLAARLREQRKELERLSEEARRANESKSAFLANVSHEIRTPMTAILGYAELLHENLDSPEILERTIETIRRNGKHLLTVINDILDLTKLESDLLEVEHVSVDLVTLLAEVRDLLLPTATAKGIALTLSCTGPIVGRVRTDPTRFRQVLVNLLGNAIKFTEEGEVALHVSLDLETERLAIAIRDTGLGMDAEQLERVFQPFVQADVSTTRRFGGSGLGLTISKHLVELIGGSLAVESSPGEGTTFTIEIPTGPIGGAAVLEEGEVRWEVRPVAPTHVNTGLEGLRILLAEDGEDNQQLIIRFLERAGATTSLAVDGEEAVTVARAALASEDPFDVIVMDMQMPVLDGYAATRTLRDEGYSGAIVALTAHAMVTDRDRCLEAGCDDYATKPVDRATLIETLRAAAERTRGTREIRQSD